MLTKKVKYVDYNGNEREEVYYFNLSAAELIDMETKEGIKYSDKIQKIINTKEYAELVKEFKDIIVLSYGIKSEDGKRFIKSKELSEEFVQSEAYNALILEFFTDTNAASNFVNGVLPSYFIDNDEKIAKKENEVT